MKLNVTPVLRTNTHPMMVVDDYIARIREMRRERSARLAALRTHRDALRYQERVQEAIARAFSPRPAKTPLNARVTGTVEIDVCRIEKILFESRPGCFVTANLYLPHGCSRNRRAPGVLADCGHSLAGKREPKYQAFAQRLASAGFMTLIIDPFNQGERDQYFMLPKKERADLSASCCFAHNMMGKQLELVGEFFGMWRAWDGIRALDYLLTRPELDPRHIGVTGNSGGGTMTTWNWAIEPRLTMAAPSCFVTSFARNLENELPADCEQYPPGVLAAGLEMADFIIARAPVPAILLGQKFDFFDRRGLQEAHVEIRRFFELLKAPPRNVELFVGPSGHGYSHHNQDAMVQFFARHAGLMGRVKKLSDRECVDVHEKLNVTPRGNVIAAGATPIFEQIAAIAKKQIAERQARPARTRAVLAQRVRRVLQLEPRPGTPGGTANPPEYRVLRPNSYEHFRAARFAVETENGKNGDASRVSGIRAFLFKPMSTDGHTLDVESRITLYLPHLSAEAELNDRALTGKWRGQAGFYALDVRGTGESMPIQPPATDFFEPYGLDYMCHGHGILFGESYLGRRVFDVLRTLDLLIHDGATRVDLVGHGQGAILAAFAGLLCSRVATVTLRNLPKSFDAWALTPIVRWPAANFPHGVLKHFDLPDIVRALGRRVRTLRA